MERQNTILQNLIAAKADLGPYRPLREGDTVIEGSVVYSNGELMVAQRTQKPEYHEQLLRETAIRTSELFPDRELVLSQTGD